MSKQKTLLPGTATETAREFDRLHTEGAEAWGINWIAANMRARNAAAALGADWTDNEVRTLVSAVTFAVASFYEPTIKRLEEQFAAPAREGE